MHKTIEIFTDGSCIGNPGPGGYASLLRFKQYEKKFSGGFFLTTNNRMELMAVIVALETIKKQPYIIKISTDSRYVQLGVKYWLPNWKKKILA